MPAREASRYPTADEGDVHAARCYEASKWRAKRHSTGLSDAYRIHTSSQGQFRERVAQGHRGLRTEEGNPGSPGPGSEPGELELDRQAVARVRDIRVHAVGEGLEDVASLGVVARPLAVVPWPAEPDVPCDPVALQVVGSHDLGELSLVRAPVHVHLPEPVLGLDKPLREEEVLQVGGVDVRDAPGIPDDFHTFIEPGKRDGS